MAKRPPIATVLVRDQPAYRADAFFEGMRAAGYDTRKDQPPRLDPGDVLVIWNRYAQCDDLARRYEHAGGIVIVAENGYLDRDRDGERLYAIALNHHNGAGVWHPGSAPRWPRVAAELMPWREGGDTILLLPQRGIGPPGVAMPRDWLERTRKALKRHRKWQIRIRPHPGRNAPALEPDLKGVWAAVTWGSGAAIKALCAGVPVFHEFHQWIGASAAQPFSVDALDALDAPFLGDRLPMLERLAWAQWSVSEIASGEPFARLLGVQYAHAAQA